MSLRYLFAVIEFVIIFLVIAFLLSTTVPGLLRLGKRSQAPKIMPLPQFIKSARNWMSEPSSHSDVRSVLSFYRCNAVTLRVQLQQNMKASGKGHDR